MVTKRQDTEEYEQWWRRLPLQIRDRALAGIAHNTPQPYRIQLRHPDGSEAPRASARGIFTASAKPAEAYPPSLTYSPTICTETLGVGRQVLWQARASADTLFAFIPVLPDGAFCEGG